MIHIGIVGLDTSHSAAFADHLAAGDDATVAAVWDGGAVRDRAYRDAFRADYGATAYDDPAAMVETVDAAMVLTADWDTHRRLAVPFLDAGVPTFVDKPLAGRVEDVDAIERAAEGTPLSGGSALPFHPELAVFPTDRPGRTLYCAGYDDPFYYGCHLVDTARLLAGSDWRAVRPIDGPGSVVNVVFDGGTVATLRLDGPADGATFGFLDVSDRTRTRAVEGSDGYDTMYKRFLDRFLDSVRGTVDDTDRLLNGGRLLLALAAVLDDGTERTRDDPLDDVRIDGGAFLADYEPYY
ncbi:Gfo/Idh/MocA family protein [Halomarina oriensis]|uniref:Gfo/Idh/MocA-like oxidoreductase N-terminal domain-containing protein n=1 Tax=Halomarina oriensis TaxID=671145 RepID=A0A6B0GJJ3_9EURY|nr:hypothetical protein [Halomarina oriensis]